MTVAPFSSRGCTDFTDLVVDDDIALEGTQAFTIIVGSSTAMVNIIDDDGELRVTQTLLRSVFVTIRTSVDTLSRDATGQF